MITRFVGRLGLLRDRRTYSTLVRMQLGLFGPRLDGLGGRRRRLGGRWLL